MPDASQNYANARNLAADILDKMPDRTIENIRDVAAKAVAGVALFGGPLPDVEILVAELAHIFAVRPGSVSALDDPTGHKPWLPDKRSGLQWRFWVRYERYLARDFQMPPPVVNGLHMLTDKILERLEDPERPAPWDRRGMVVGSVQSGKTANYTGLICKAIDSGYKLVIVLAGIHTNLRSQTQIRIDEGVTGFDTRNSRRLNPNNLWIGVGRNPGERYPIHSLTSSAEDGDFNKRVAMQMNVMLGSDPVVLVVKKNSNVLKNLQEWVGAVAGHRGGAAGKLVIRDVPLLLIDDEADNASINTKGRQGSDPDLDVTAINGRIRGILDSFEKSAYVGYTATPFANIFINPEVESPRHGKDLFPSSFIINVEAPSNYVSPKRVFGLDGDPDREIPALPGLDVVRPIDDWMAAFPPKHRMDHVPVELPDSLKRAIRCFILVCAARRARGQASRHNSMLVHVTRFQNVQNVTARLVGDELLGLQRRLRDGDGSRQPTLLDELRQLWEQEFASLKTDFGEDAGSPVTWAQVEAELHSGAAKIDVIAVNASAQTPLDYKEHEALGRSVIVVGGDKLSRGLTLEGLSISYFLRTSRMYDTLLQIGRWFGYRPGYLDLCRLFTTTALEQWYRHIALAEMELRREFDYMVATGQTPERYGLRVRTHPAGMIVTALNKMSHSRIQELSWEGVLVQTTQFFKAPGAMRANLVAATQLVGLLGAPAAGRGQNSPGTMLWSDVKPDSVATFISSIRFPPEAARASGAELASFIRNQASKPDPELTGWTVALIGNMQAATAEQRTIAGRQIGLIGRTPAAQDEITWSTTKANILNPRDESWDFQKETFTEEWLDSVASKPDLWEDLDWLREQIGRDAAEVALDLTVRWQKATPFKIRPPEKGTTTRPNGRVVRVLRPRSRGLLLIYPLAQMGMIPAREGHPEESTGLDPLGDPVIGVALSFPSSQTVLGVQYRVNRVWDAIAREDEEYDNG